MNLYADAPLESLQDYFISMAQFRGDQCEFIPERTVDQLKQAALFTSLAGTAFQVSAATRDRFVRAVHQWKHDDLVRHAIWKIGEDVGLDETLVTAEAFLSRVCDVLETSR